MTYQKPTGFENDLAAYSVVLVDGWCGEPVAWGFKRLNFLGEERFSELGKYGKLECVDMSSWVLVVKTLTRVDAIEKYGPVSDEVFGPRGGWKSITFGDKKFMHRYLRPST